MATPIKSTPAKRFGYWLKLRMSNANLTYRDMATMMQIPEGNIWNWANGSNLPNPQAFERLCKFLTDQSPASIADQLGLPDQLKAQLETNNTQPELITSERLTAHSLTFADTAIEVHCLPHENNDLDRIFADLRSAKIDELIGELRKRFPYTRIITD